MSLHKLSAGHGYDYLIRQVAALDATHRGRTDLASYYTERGETPGRWVGRGLAGVDGLEAGDVVTGKQMRLLFAEGRHPLAQTSPAGGRVLALGVPYRPSTGEQPFQAALRTRFADHNTALGLPRRAALPAEVRARLRGELAAEWFRRQEGRDPKGDLELASALARWSRPAPAAVGGYDLTFSPVKSVSALWPVADPDVAAKIEQAHQAAVAAALRFVEDRALFTREGTGGVRQVNVTGLVAGAFTHRDSRAGDPDLHTHVAVANKVQTLGGRWLSIDGRILHAAKVAASETYNTALEHHLTTFLGVRFAERPGGDQSKRPVREIVGVDPRLNQRWSARRQVIDLRKAELAADFARDHGRPPGRVEMLQLAQQATLETRDAKHEPRTLAEQRTVWRAEAVDTLGGPERIDAMIDQVLNPAVMPMAAATPVWRARTADRVLATVEEHRATWQLWHLWAETQRQLRGSAIHPADLPEVATAVIDEAIARSVQLTPADVPIKERRRDGALVFTVAGSTQYTSTRIVAAEQRVMDAAALTDGQALEPAAVDLSLGEADATCAVLDAGQKQMVRSVATDRRRVQLVLAPAGAGKTTALRVLADMWTEGGGHILGLAPSAAAAAQLGEATGITADTLARLTRALDHHRPLPEWADRIGSKTLLLIDEAGMADTPTLDTAIGHTLRHGGRVCLVGDDQQLGAIGAGGILTDLQNTHGAVRLTQLHRFTDPDEAAATLQVRNGDPAAVDFYTERDRIEIADPSGLLDRLLAAWRHDQRQGLDSLMLALSRRQVADLNQRARAARLAGHQPAFEIDLADGNRASVGDLMITRRNDRRLTHGRDWVRNGDRWTVTALTPDGGMRATHRRTGRPINLPGTYVREAVELGYATTIHTAQGVTADTTHSLVDELMTREQLYTMVSRGRTANHLYIAVGDVEPHHILINDTQEPTATDILQRVLSRTSLPVSATTVRAQHERAAVRAPVRTRALSPEQDHGRVPADRGLQAPAR